MFKKNKLIILLLCIAHVVFSQDVVYITNNPVEADYNVIFVNNKMQADVIVYVVDNHYLLENTCNAWLFTQNKNIATLKIYIVPNGYPKAIRVFKANTRVLPTREQLIYKHLFNK